MLSLDDHYEETDQPIIQPTPETSTTSTSVADPNTDDSMLLSL